MQYIYKEYINEIVNAYGVNYRIHNIYTVFIFHQCSLELNIYVFTPYCPNAHEYLQVIVLLLSLKFFNAKKIKINLPFLR